MPLSPGTVTPSLLVAVALILATSHCGSAPSPWPSTPAASGAPRSSDLFREVTRADSVFFDALFARCDAELANTFLTPDVEFYDDRSGLSVGDDLRQDFRRLTDNCPAGNGVRRILLPESVEVHPVDGFGAVHTGVHHFVENGASTSTVGRFTTIWKRAGGEWKMARIISLHEVMDAERAAGLRR
jgi:hypothetical protein